MSLIICRECGKEFSNQAVACPNCGCPTIITQQQSISSIPPVAYSSPIQPVSPLPKKTESVVGIIGLIFSCFFCIPIFSFVGLILCIVALCSKKNKSVCGAVGIGIAIFSILLGILAPQFMKYVDEVKKDSATNTTIETSSVESTEASTSTTIHPGETVETDDLKITFISCGDYETDNSFLTPEEGYKYVIATFEFENIGTSDEFVSCWDFDCYADGYAIEQSYLSDDNLSATISAGKKAKGSVTFEVPTDATEIELEYTVNIWTEEKIIFLLSDN